MTNSIYGEVPQRFGWAGQNKGYAMYWRRIISDYFKNRHNSKIKKLAIHGKIRQCRMADKIAAMEV